MYKAVIPWPEQNCYKSVWARGSWLRLYGPGMPTLAVGKQWLFVFRELDQAVEWLENVFLKDRPYLEVEVWDCDVGNVRRPPELIGININGFANVWNRFLKDLVPWDEKTLPISFIHGVRPPKGTAITDYVMLSHRVWPEPQMWCEFCKSWVDPEGDLDADGLFNICPTCGEEVFDEPPVRHPLPGEGKTGWSC